MENIDMTLASIANTNKQNNNYSNEKIIEFRDRYFENSIQDVNKSKKQKVRGETYRGKKDLIKNIETALKISSAILVLGITLKGVEVYNVVDAYNDVLEQKMENELTEGNINAYNKYHSHPIIDGLADYQAIKDAKEELKETGNYNILGTNVENPDKEYTTYTVDEYRLSNLQEDAIDMVTDNVIDEYSKISVRGGK